MNQELLDRVLASPRLPSLPTVALEVIDLVQQPDVNIKQIASTIQNDPALAGKILKTVNSSFYGQSYAVSTITHALVVLGLNSVKTLALGFSLVGNLRDGGGDGFDHVTFWKRSLYAGTAARNLSRHLNLVQQEEAFLGGLMQDLGMLALHQVLGQSYSRILAACQGDHRRLAHLENQAFGFDHAIVGGALAERWRLPPVLVQPIRHHEAPGLLDSELAPLVRCIGIGNYVADVFINENPADALQGYYQSIEEWFGVSPAIAEPMLKDAHRSAAETRRLFDLPTGGLGNADEILARANDTLLQINLQSAQQTEQLQAQNRQLVEQASTDSLTGAANRRRFNDFIAAEFAAASTSGRPLSLLFLDADHFKKFNDTYGHPTGDRVLVALAKLLKANMPDTALVARYGGEEFAVVLPGTDRKSAAHLAENARRKLETTPVLADDGAPLKVTASIGVATQEPCVFDKPEQLIKAADQGVYAAKASGRNCVRIFTPRPRAAA